MKPTVPLNLTGPQLVAIQLVTDALRPDAVPREVYRALMEVSDKIDNEFPQIERAQYQLWHDLGCFELVYENDELAPF